MRTHGGEGKERQQGSERSLHVVIDANMVAAAIIRPDGWTAGGFARRDIEWIAPGLLPEELEEHAREYALKAGCTAREWRRRLRTLTRRILLIETEALLAAWNSPLARAVRKIDPDDEPYAAALVVMDADFLWTRDGALLDALPAIAVTILPEPAEPTHKSDNP